jgi:hypothetical protein
MGNIVSSFVGVVLVYYMKVKNKLVGSTECQQAGTPFAEEEKKENTDSVIVVKKDNDIVITRNEYQLIKSHEEYEYLKENKEDNLIEEISKEIKNVNIEFDNNEEGIENIENEETKGKQGDENLDDLKMQILSEHEDNV